MDNNEQIKNALSQIYTNLYSPDNVNLLQWEIGNIKEEIEKIVDEDSFILSRIKGPISTLNKVNGKPSYAEEWNKMKDLVGLMVVVDSNQDVDKVLYYFCTNYMGLKNPNCKDFFCDFRKKDIRPIDNSRPRIIDMPSPKGYQVNDGYKNVRLNMMVGEYPFEIQIKTREQYIAHMATHDPIYKSKVIKDENEKNQISDALFPYFETYAHLKLHEKDMPDAQILQCKKDLREIFERNKDIYEKYPEVYNEACSIFAIYVFVMKNRKQLYADEFLDDSVINNQLLEAELLRIFHYKQKEFLKKDKSLTDSKSFMKTTEAIADMSYNEYKEMVNKLAGEYRKELCIISGVFDMVREKDIELIKRCAKSFRRVVVSVYDDELAKIYLGHEPMYSAKDRMKALEMIDDVASVTMVSCDGDVKDREVVEPFMFEPQPTKKYKVGYLPGVFDMFHPGHIEYIQQASELCEKLIVGIKTDDYVILNKGKTTIQNQDERKKIAEALVCVDNVVITDKDILPPLEVLDELNAVAINDKEDKAVIFLGSDWHTEEGLKKKNVLSLAEKDFLENSFKDIELGCIPRGNSKRSSTGYRDRAKDAAQMINPYELKTLGV